jgi:hypothetical protein
MGENGFALILVPKPIADRPVLAYNCGEFAAAAMFRTAL